MTRRRDRHRFPPRSATVFGRVRAHEARPAQRRRRTFQFERLEDRLTMDGEGLQVVANLRLAADIDVAAIDFIHIDPVFMPAPTPPAAATSSDEFPDRFASMEEFEAWLTEAAVAQWGHLFGQRTSSWQYPSQYYPWYADTDVFVEFAAVGQVAVNRLAFAALDSTSSFSSTNVQVEGVDEADLIETDGQYLYILSGDELVIVEAGVGDELRIASRVQVEGNAVGMYLTGDRLTIVSSSQAGGNFGAAVDERVQIFGRNWGYGYSSEPATTTVTVLDISDRSAPTLVQKSEMDGKLVASRVVDSQLRLVLTNSINLPSPLMKPLDGGSSVTAAPLEQRVPQAMPETAVFGRFYLAEDQTLPVQEDYVYETQAEYLARIKADLFKSVLPGLRVLGVDGNVIEERALMDATDVYRPGSPSDHNITTVATFDLTSNVAGPADTLAVFSADTPQVYMSADSLYLFSSNTAYYSGWWNSQASNSTTIRKFDFDAATHDVSLVAQGRVEGTLLNQFAADELNGDLRVVTSSGWNAHQNLFVLRQSGKKLDVIGAVDDIAPGERLHSVRFMGERAFVVTFRQVDPLFAIDLSDPTNPEVMGELKIPGVSGYLQPLDAEHLIGVGRAMDESGWMFSDLEISIFGVADLSHPELLHKYSFEGGWSTTTPVLGPSWIPFTGDAHAAAYFPDEQIFAMPVFSTEGGNLDGVESSPFFEPGDGGLQVFRIDVETGFAPLAFLEHDTLIERAVKIGDHLFAISSGRVSVHALDDPTIQLGTLELHPEGATLTQLTMFEAMPTLTTLAALAPPDETVERPDEPVHVPVSVRPVVGPFAMPTKRSEAVRRLVLQQVHSWMPANDALLAGEIADKLSERLSAVGHEPIDEVFSTTDGDDVGANAWDADLGGELNAPLAFAGAG